MLFRLDYARMIVGRLILIMFVSFLPLLCAQIVQVHEEKVSAETVTPKPGALQVLDAESLQMEKMLDREQRDFSFRLRNGQDKALKLLRVRVNCPCLSIQEAPPADFTLAPGSECQIKGRMDAGKVKVGKFSRMILVEVEGQELQLVPVEGESVPMLDFESGPSIDLGTFAGVDVPWSRTIHIKSRFTGEQAFELLPPPEHANFEHKLEKLSPQEYQFTFTPKLPLPRGTIKHIVELPTRGIERYGAVQVGLFGRVTGWQLALDSQTVLIDLKTAKPDEKFIREVMVVADSGERKGGRRRVSNAAREKELADKLDNVQLASEEEEVAGSLNKLETWQKIAADIEMTLPDGVTLEKIPQEDGILLRMTLLEDYFVKRLRSTVHVSYQKKVIDRLNIVGRQ